MFAAIALGNSVEIDAGMPEERGILGDEQGPYEERGHFAGRDEIRRLRRHLDDLLHPGIRGDLVVEVAAQPQDFGRSFFRALEIDALHHFKGRRIVEEAADADGSRKRPERVRLARGIDAQGPEDEREVEARHRGLELNLGIGLARNHDEAAAAASPECGEPPRALEIASRVALHVRAAIELAELLRHISFERRRRREHPCSTACAVTSKARPRALVAVVKASPSTGSLRVIERAGSTSQVVG